MSTKLLTLGNDFEVEVYITQKRASDGTVIPSTGLVGLTYFLCASKTGTAIHPSLSASLVERTGSPGTYFATFLGVDLSAHLVSWTNGSIWGICMLDTSLKSAQIIHVLDSRVPL